MALTVKINSDTSGFNKGISSVGSGITGLVGGLGLLTGAAVGVTAAISGLKLGVGLLQDASSKAAGIETLTKNFETLLGSADAAKKRMEEIAKLGKDAPTFSREEFAKTSKLLASMGDGALSTGKGLIMVGDAAAFAQQPIEEVGLHIGRIYDAITSGTSAGESVARLQELGLISGKLKRSFEDLAESQKKGHLEALTQQEAMALLQATFEKTKGTMEDLAETIAAKLSTLVDNISDLKIAFGTGFNDGLKIALDAVNNFLPKLKDKFGAVGHIVGLAIKDSFEGNWELFGAIGASMGKLLVAGLKAVTVAGLDDLGSTYFNWWADTLNAKAKEKGMSGQEPVANWVRENFANGTNLSEQLYDKVGTAMQESSELMQDALNGANRREEIRTSMSGALPYKVVDVNTISKQDMADAMADAIRRSMKFSPNQSNLPVTVFK